MNGNDSDREFGAINIERVESFSINGGRVDFGDLPHFFGAPGGDAIICWYYDGRVAVMGLLFSDNFGGPQVANMEIRFRRTDGRFTRLTRRSLATQGGPAAFKLVKKVSPPGSINEVRIRLRVFEQTDLGPVSSLVGRRTFTR